MPLGDQARTLLTSALRDPLVVTRYRAKMVQVPGSECLWWRGAVSGRGHGRKRAELHRLKHSSWWHSGQAGPMTTHRRPFGSGRAGSPWLFPGAYQGAGYLSASPSEQLGLEIRPGRGAALCDPADELPAAVVAALLGISVDTAGRWGALVKRDWTGYIAERDGQTLGPEQT